MHIKLNGQKHETTARTVAELLQELQTPEHGIAVAVNEQVIRRAEHTTAPLQQGDEVELIRAVQGG